MTQTIDEPVVKKKIRGMDELELRMTVDNLRGLIRMTGWSDPLMMTYQNCASAARNELFNRGLNTHHSSKTQERSKE